MPPSEGEDGHRLERPTSRAGRHLSDQPADPRRPAVRVGRGGCEHAVGAGPDATRVWLVLRDDTTVKADRSVFFTSDRVAVKATMRIGFGLVHAASVVKVTTA